MDDYYFHSHYQAAGLLQSNTSDLDVDAIVCMHPTFQDVRCECWSKRFPGALVSGTSESHHAVPHRSGVAGHPVIRSMTYNEVYDKTRAHVIFHIEEDPSDFLPLLRITLSLAPAPCARITEAVFHAKFSPNQESLGDLDVEVIRTEPYKDGTEERFKAVQGNYHVAPSSPISPIGSLPNFEHSGDEHHHHAHKMIHSEDITRSDEVCWELKEGHGDDPHAPCPSRSGLEPCEELWVKLNRHPGAVRYQIDVTEVWGFGADMGEMNWKHMTSGPKTATIR
ncbi:hypothetical protein JAAARDRAFT_30025 [Jaapia argillacea MUCL 33604]|uniref:Uncharacterized protein n=1 Tax=Jaapia argillacea MUCL 33604 TaxID=933084 RepID=A0A067Q562_9AGAM|nr:hypothetical protein JAAARDRAFT_30025 [Jaapia argillacea MUCL 33604]